MSRDAAASLAGGWHGLFSEGRTGSTFMLCLGVALYAFNDFVVITTMPTAVVELGAPALISLSFSIFLVAAIVGGSVGGLMKQRFGARSALLLTAGLIACGSLMTSVAVSMEMVLAGRIFTGFGEGVVAAICYALIPEFYPPSLVAKVFGAEAVVWALAAFLGPLLGGILTEVISWRVAFLVNVPLIIIFAVFVIQKVKPESGAERVTERVPLGRLMMVTASILAVSFAGTTTETWIIIPLLAFAFLGLFATFSADRSKDVRLFPKGAFVLGAPLGAIFWVALLMPIGQATVSVYIALMMQHVFGYDPSEAGFVAAILALSWSGTAIVVATVVREHLALTMVRLGPLVMALGLVATSFGIWTGLAGWVFLGQVFVGGGFGLNWAFLSHHVMTVAAPGERDLASGLLPTVQSAGYALGAALAGLTAAVYGLGDSVAAVDLKGAAVWIFGIGSVMGLAAFAISFSISALPAADGRSGSTQV
ncbi:putative multidrug-efflux transporter [Hartmannibacter diazotrophicus]|uniref:Putative multidrug-efflux transporter n=1 Tax=Hartmannibacter diazotrophicus TaxID=1482074 RepID=A0A2C9D6Z8_9HYPH|nr:MFS transporter [Hartmannibacter diazotrophicus]SON56104.1 putative multidrug-efflux transporter [Hartmannibacter diazotrophicus]